MKKINKNQKLGYQLFAHGTREVNGEYYCRALNTVMNKDDSFCNCCPLFGGKYSDEEMCQCYYYDLDFWVSDYIEPLEMKRRIDALIELGVTYDFPEYLGIDEKSVRFSIIEKAIIFASNAHKGAFRKGTDIPYIVHPMETMMIVAHLTNDIEVIAAAALHDVIEDTKYTYDDIEGLFGKRIAELVDAESENKRPGIPKEETWHVRKEENLEKAKNKPIEARMIMLGDKLSNLRASKKDFDKCGVEMWNKFNMKDINEQKWYFGEILNVLSDFNDSEYYKELEEIYCYIFS